VKARYFIYLSFKGTNYSGWQKQPRKTTIQELLDESLSTVLQEKIVTTGAGRTDTGVHARRFVAHFDSVKTNLHDSDNLVFRLNSFLPPDIAVNRVRKVKETAHARFDARSRTYEYLITTIKDPMKLGYALYRQGSLDIDSMNRASGYLLNHSNFTSFSKLHGNAKTNECKIYEARWEVDGTLIRFTISANRFLRNMVRAIVGTMIEVGRGKLSPEDINMIIMAKDRQKAGKSARAEGLYLTNIEYPENIVTP